ncbi:hypothetical protein Taro_009462 [Colocasia esculenta]|uniref:Uncharacterized protein n=1 Tax=Colocasia esculenta TaxID=4460 RepID=A0A843TWC5_COLES|nr:hypothetical protein [Colocasia esculenta]
MHGSPVPPKPGRHGRTVPCPGASGTRARSGHPTRERQLVSAPFKEGTGSFLWILGPLAFISSLLLPQIFLSSFVEATIKDDILAGNWPINGSWWAEKNSWWAVPVDGIKNTGGKLEALRRATRGRGDGKKTPSDLGKTASEASPQNLATGVRRLL